MDTSSYKVVITEQAENDLEEIYNYINNELKANKAARNLKNKIKKQILNLVDNPIHVLKYVLNQNMSIIIDL